MASTTSSNRTTFDMEALKRALEERDAAAQLAFFDEDAEISVVDRDNQPSAPLVFRGRDAIRGYLEDVAGREMTHEVERTVVGEDTAAYSLGCRYPEGARVRCLALLELRDGRIVRLDGIQAWDEG